MATSPFGSVSLLHLTALNLCHCFNSPSWICTIVSPSTVLLLADYLGIFGAVLAAIPDFKWGAATNGETDNDGFAIVTVTATGTT